MVLTRGAWLLTVAGCASRVPNCTFSSLCHYLPLLLDPEHHLSIFLLLFLLLFLSELQALRCRSLVVVTCQSN